MTPNVLKPNPNSSTILERYGDADRASDPDDRKSTLVFVFSEAPTWFYCNKKKQHIVSQSSIEAEYRSLVHLVAETTQITELKFPLSKPQLYGVIISVPFYFHPILFSMNLISTLLERKFYRDILLSNTFYLLIKLHIYHQSYFQFLVL